MTMKINYKFVAIVIVFLIGLYFCIEKKYSRTIQRIKRLSKFTCKKGERTTFNKYKKAMIPGVNPIKFDNLEEYGNTLNGVKSRHKMSYFILRRNL